MSIQANFNLIKDHLIHEEYDSALTVLKRLPASDARDRVYVSVKEEADYLRKRGKKLFDFIASGKSNFKLNDKVDKLFKNKILQYFELLLTKTIGQNLIEKIINSKHVVNIIPSKETLVETGRGVSLMEFNTDQSGLKVLASDRFGKVAYRHPCEPTLFFHELCHINNYLNGTSQFAIQFKDDEWETGEEQYAIAGTLIVDGHHLLPPTPYCENMFQWLLREPLRLNHLVQ